MLFSWDLLLTGFADALTWTNLLWALVGCLVGTLIGVLPGIGPSAGIAILLPMTTMIPPTSGIIMMAAIYYGAMYGGSTTAIVVNIPGEASSVPTASTATRWPNRGGRAPPWGSPPSRPSWRAPSGWWGSPSSPPCSPASRSRSVRRNISP